MKFNKLLNKRSEEKKRREEFSKKIKIDIQNRCAVILKRYHVKKAVIFGSVVNQKASERSDIDLLVQPLPSAEYWNLHFDLEQIVGLPIDFFTQDDDPRFVNKILERGEVIYEI